MNIDWSKAPEGATHYLPEDEDHFACWVRGRYTMRAGIQSDWVADEVKSVEHLLIERPTEWTGEGLPPVGAVCEYYWAADDSWRSGICVAHHDGRAVICDRDDEDCAERFDAHHLRPTRTPEQIAAEERERSVKALAAIIGGDRARIPYSAFEAADRVLNAGYRKVEP